MRIFVLSNLVDPCLNVTCEKDEICKLRTVFCIVGPCPPIAVCEKKLCEYGEPAVIGYASQPIYCGREGDPECPSPYECQSSLGSEPRNVCCPPKDNNSKYNNIVEWF